jgi:hypothetical protein
MTTLRIIRTLDDGRQTRGHLVVMTKGIAQFAAVTLELPWRDNQRRVSCIPPGTYKGVKHTSPKFGQCVHITGVPERSEILIHPANRVDQLLGCIAPGMLSADLNGDGLEDVTNSKFTCENLLRSLPNEFEVKVEESESFIEKCEKDG